MMVLKDKLVDIVHLMAVVIRYFILHIGDLMTINVGKDTEGINGEKN